MANPQAVLVPSQLSAEHLAFLRPYLVQFSESQCLFAYSFEFDGIFASLEVVHNDGSKKRVKIRIPLNMVLATMDLAENDKIQFGFV